MLGYFGSLLGIFTSIVGNAVGERSIGDPQDYRVVSIMAATLML